MRALCLLLVCVPAWAQTTLIYSRADAVHAQRAAGLVRLYQPVLIDTALPPGVSWRAVVYAGICSSRYVLLLWSASAAASVEVAREIQTAVLCSVPLVPVLLDGTPLPGDVGQVHAIDWR
jgi:hypothetical protein